MKAVPQIVYSFYAPELFAITSIFYLFIYCFFHILFKTSSLLYNSLFPVFYSMLASRYLFHSEKVIVRIAGRAFTCDLPTMFSLGASVYLY